MFFVCFVSGQIRQRFRSHCSCAHQPLRSMMHTAPSRVVRPSCILCQCRARVHTNYRYLARLNFISLWYADHLCWSLNRQLRQGMSCLVPFENNAKSDAMSARKSLLLRPMFVSLAFSGSASKTKSTSIACTKDELKSYMIMRTAHLPFCRRTFEVHYVAGSFLPWLGGDATRTALARIKLADTRFCVAETQIRRYKQ